MEPIILTAAQLEELATAVATKVLAATTSTRIVPAQGTTLVIGPIEIDVEGFELHIDGRDVTLKPREFQILAALAENCGRYLSRAQLLARVAPDDDRIEDERTIDVHIRRLRLALGEHAGMIQTMQGVGYRLARGTPAKKK